MDEEARRLVSRAQELGLRMTDDAGKSLSLDRLSERVGIELRRLRDWGTYDQLRERATQVVELRTTPMFLERTQLNRKLLVLVSAITLAMAYLGLVPQKITTFGLEFQPADQAAILKFGSLVVVYFLLMFVITAWNEQRAWLAKLSAAHETFDRVRIQAVAVARATDDEELKKRIHRYTPLETMPHRLVHWPTYLPGYFVDFLLPIGLAIFATYACLTQGPANATKSSKAAIQVLLPLRAASGHESPSNRDSLRAPLERDVFLVQYVGQIAPTVVQQMAPFAQMKSVSTGRKIYYGVIDGDDSARLVAAYPAAFKATARTRHP